MAWPKGKPRKKEWILPRTIIMRGVKWDIDEYIESHFTEALAALIERDINKRSRNTARR